MQKRQAAGIILYKDGKMLLQHRSDDAPRNPGLWGLFGGGIEEGETPIEAVRRETMEELEYRLNDPRFISIEESDIQTVHLFIEEYDGSPLVQHEGKGMGWFTLDEALLLDISAVRRASFERLRDRLIKEMAE
jgi:8-oxo-dGTP pyrophosphatase MutT (NUDIX family)